MVYDVTNYETFQNIEDIWMNGLREEEISDDVPKVLVGNKADDEDQRDVETEEAMEYAEKYSMLFFETSAQNDVNVDEAFLSVNRQLIEAARGSTNEMEKCCGCILL